MKQLYIKLEDKDYDDLVVSNKRMRGSIFLGVDGKSVNFHRHAVGGHRLPAYIYPLTHGKISITTAKVSLRMNCKKAEKNIKKSFLKDLKDAEKLVTSHLDDVKVKSSTDVKLIDSFKTLLKHNS